ncbi:MAG: hypothetical protein R3E31_19270 [Chloroflexota bacterium]
MAFPTQRQEAFFSGHIAAFHHFGGVPQTLIYDNLTTAVQRVLEGRNRQEQKRFISFRSHHLFNSRFCTPAPGIKGVLSTVYQIHAPELPRSSARGARLCRTQHLFVGKCIADDQRQVDRQPDTIGVMWQAEQPHLRACPDHDFATYVSREVTLSRYGQVI